MTYAPGYAPYLYIGLAGLPRPFWDEGDDGDDCDDGDGTQEVARMGMRRVCAGAHFALARLPVFRGRSGSLRVITYAPGYAPYIYIYIGSPGNAGAPPHLCARVCAVYIYRLARTRLVFARGYAPGYAP